MKTNNIRYDITMELIFYYKLDDIKLFDFNLLVQINPNKYKWEKTRQKENAEYIYDEKTKLQTAWITAIVKASLNHIFAFV
jgi:hypothetical protein